MPRLTSEREKEIRRIAKVAFSPVCDELLAEIDALREENAKLNEFVEKLRYLCKVYKFENEKLKKEWEENAKLRERIEVLRDFIEGVAIVPNITGHMAKDVLRWDDEAAGGKNG